MFGRLACSPTSAFQASVSADVLAVQGHHIECHPADLLFCTADDSEGGDSDSQLSLFVLAPLLDERAERYSMGWIWKGEWLLL